MSEAKRKTRKRRIYSDEIKEQARARVAAGETQAKVARDLGVAKSTLHSWLTEADRDGHQESREQRKERFIHKAWDVIDQALILSSQKIRLATVSTERFEPLLKELVFLLKEGENVTADQIRDVIKAVSRVMDIGLTEISTFAGTIYDKQALASGDVTTRGEVKGQVTQRYEYDITQRIISDPETAKLADQLLKRTANSDAGMVRTHNKPWPVAAVRPSVTPEPEDT